MQITLIQQTPNPIETIAKIASICYDSDPKDPMKLVKHLYKNGHHSVFEHIYFTFKIEGISRACSHQLVRHRHCSFTQRSQRYCSEDGFEFVTPPTVDVGRFANDMDDINDWYEEYQSKGILNEDARYILPNACATELYLSCNLRELIHISNERLCNKAQWEIRELVQKMVSLIDPELQFMLVPKCKSGRIICNSPCGRLRTPMVRGGKRMNSELAYTSYVRHALRFYSRYLHIEEFKNEADKANWLACHRAIQSYSLADKDILVCVYGERDTLADNVYNASKRYGVHQDAVWELMRGFERKVAVERGLI